MTAFQRKINFFLCAIFLLGNFNLQAQKRCNTQYLHNQKMKTDETYRQKYQIWERSINRALKENVHQRQANCTSPVFFSSCHTF